MGKSKILDLEMKLISGESIALEKFAGKVLLIVNVASKCGFTKQYDGLQKLYERYQADGLEILGFPANDFLSQEPGDNAEIAKFCRINFGVTFPLFAKIHVKGKKISPLYKLLTDKSSNPDYGGKITWNFNKFLLNRQGEIVGRFNSRTTPDDEKLISAVEAALQE
jgi:glutathione peroxidase